MYEGKRILAFIPARGGSKGIKNKNIVDLAGKPLIAYTIEAAVGSMYIDKVIVSTDSSEIADVAKKHGADVPFLRPSELASDHSKTIDAVIHAIRFFKEIGDSYDVLVLLQPTQPLRTSSDIDDSIVYFFEKGGRGLVSISPVQDNPILIRTINDEGNVSSILGTNSTCRRQDMKEYYRVNGCIYINNLDEINGDTSFNDNPVGFKMDVSHSVDIDDYVDLNTAEYYLKNR